MEAKPKDASFFDHMALGADIGAAPLLSIKGPTIARAASHIAYPPPSIALPIPSTLYILSLAY